MIEDRINRFDLEFDRPCTVESAEENNNNNNKDVLIAQAVKGMLAKGPELRMEITPTMTESGGAVSGQEEYTIKVRASKGKKNVLTMI
jgi:hypothetical protein